MNKQDNINATPLSLSRAVIAGVIAALFMIYSIFPSLIFACAVIAVFSFCACRANKRLIVATLALIAIGFLLLGGSAVILSSVLAIIGAAIAGGIMLSGKRSAAVYLIFICAVYGAAAFITSPVDAIPTLTSIPLAVTLAVCARLRTPRVSSICALSAVLIITLVAPLAVSFCIEHGAEAAEQFKLLIEETKAAIADTIVKTYEEVSAVSEDAFPIEITPASAKEAVDVIFPLIPAMLVIISNLIAFSLHTLSLWIRFGLGQLPAKEEADFAMSKVSAWAYVVSFVAMLFSFSDSDLAQTVMMAMMTLNLILMPSFMLVGFKAVVAAFKIAGGKLKPLHVILIVLGLMYCGAFIFYPLTAYGVMFTIKSKDAPDNAPKNTPEE